MASRQGQAVAAEGVGPKAGSQASSRLKAAVLVLTTLMAARLIWANTSGKGGVNGLTRGRTIGLATIGRGLLAALSGSLSTKVPKVGRFNGARPDAAVAAGDDLCRLLRLDFSQNVSRPEGRTSSSA